MSQFCTRELGNELPGSSVREMGGGASADTGSERSCRGRNLGDLGGRETRRETWFRHRHGVTVPQARACSSWSASSKSSVS